MSKASEWAARYRKADEAKDFSWQRIRDTERDRPTFTVFEPINGLGGHFATVTEDGGLAFGDWPHINRERSIAFARWILETFGEESAR